MSMRFSRTRMPPNFSPSISTCPGSIVDRLADIVKRYDVGIVT